MDEWIIAGIVLALLIIILATWVTLTLQYSMLKRINKKINSLIIITPKNPKNEIRKADNAEDR